MHCVILRKREVNSPLLLEIIHSSYAFIFDQHKKKIQRECVLAQSIILTKDLSDHNFFLLVQSLAKKVYECYNENVQELTFLALKLSDLVGSSEFN